MYAILASPAGTAFHTAAHAEDKQGACKLADDAVFGMGHARALVVQIDAPARIVYDTEHHAPYRNCPRCGGHGRVQCAVDADEPCDACDGTGRTEEPERWITCHTCAGAGRPNGGAPCLTCHGTGVEEDWESWF